MVVSKKLFLTLVFTILLISSFSNAKWFELNPNEHVKSPAITVLHSDDVSIVLEIEIPGFELSEVLSKGEIFQTIRIPNCRRMCRDGESEIPVITKLVAIPDNCQVTLTLLKSDYYVHSNLGRMAAHKNGPDSEKEKQLPNDFWPEDIATVGSPGILRDFKVVPLIIYPVRYNSAKGEVLIYKQIRIELRFSGFNQANVKRRAEKLSAAFRGMYESLILNYDFLSLADTDYQRGSYLIITYDDFFEHIQPLAYWKHRQGWSTKVVKLSEIGSNPSGNQIRDYILDAYFNWEVPPEYVLLVGDTHIQHIGEFPSFYKQPPGGGDSDVTDHPYSLLEGEDYFSDISVGRLSVDSVNELIVIVHKILKYEREPSVGQTEWYKRALLVAGNYSETPPIPSTPRLTSLWLRDKMLDNGYTEIDTVFYPPTTGPQLISASINRGVGFVNYRGWGDANGWHYPNFKVDDINALNNGLMLPVMTSFVCNSGDYGNLEVDPCFGEAWLRVGTPINPKGGVAFYGPSDLFTSTKFNNALDAGMYWGIFDENLYTLGAATLRGKLELFLGFPNLTEPGDWVEFYFHVYNILGDPGLAMWTDVPQSLTVSHPDEIPVGQNAIEVSVRNVASEPIEGASVCLFKGDEIYTHGFTDVSGVIDFPILPTTAGTLYVTVTAHNFIPYLGHTSVTENRSYIGYYSYDVDDREGGNNDGQVNAGETIELSITVKNFGTGHIAIAVTGTLKIVDEFITVTDSVASFGSIPPESTSTSETDFEFVVHSACPHGHRIPFELLTEDDLGSYRSEFSLPVVGPSIAYTNHSVDDNGGNGVFDPGETADLTVAISNCGLQDITGVTGTLRSESQAVIVLDSVGTFNDIPAGRTALNTFDLFVLTVAPSAAVGRVVPLYLFISGDNDFSDTTNFSLTIGEVSTMDPIGPDNYGYYAFDNTDVGYNEAPLYNWIEIDPDYGGSGTKMVFGDDDKDIINLPFSFRYYGIDFDRMTVCSNGWLAMGETWMNDFRNWGIPAALGPPGMIAPFWDDLDSTLVSEIVQNEVHVCYSYEQSEHRLIVEWSRVLNHYDSSLEILQAILYDPEYHPTVTGDGEIVFQYHTVNNGDARSNYATVGIESPSQAEGLEYTFANRYPPAAALLTAGLAIKFTTDPPDTFMTDIEEELSSSIPNSFYLFQNHPNPFNPSTAISFTIPMGVGLVTGHSSLTTLKIFNLLGQEVRTLVNESKAPGFYTVSWDGRDEKGEEVSTGLYFSQLEWGDVRETKRMILMK